MKIDEAFDICQSIFNKLKMTEVNKEVEDIEKAFHGGIYHDKVQSFIKEKIEDKTKNNKDFIQDEHNNLLKDFTLSRNAIKTNLLNINACEKKDCSKRDQCRLTFTVDDECVWIEVAEYGADVWYLSLIINKISKYMEDVDKQEVDRFSEFSF